MGNDVTSHQSRKSKMEQRILYAECHLPAYTAFHENIPQWSTDLQLGMLDQSCLYQYGEVQGDINLREAISHKESTKFQLPIDPSQLIITAGGLHALHIIFQNEKNHGHRKILCHAPIFKNITDNLKLHQYTIDFFEIDGRGYLTESYDKGITAKPEVIYLNIPNNPTGVVANDNALTQIVEFCHRNEVRLVLDMVYDEYMDSHTPIRNILVNQNARRNILIVNSFSKNYGAPGLRIGWILGDEKVIEEIAHISESQLISIPELSQQIARKLLDQCNISWLRDQVEQNRSYILDNQHLYPNITFRESSQGVQLIAPFKYGSASDFADNLLSQHHLLIATSDNFAGVKEEFIRIPCGYPIERIKQALSIIDTALLQWSEQYSREVDLIC